jgi:hypothetical protein
VLLAQAAWYLLSGAVSLVSRDLFEAVTGPKADYWLVRMVGLLAVVIGLTIGIGARAARPTSRWSSGLLSGSAPARRDRPRSSLRSPPEVRSPSRRWIWCTG